MATSADILVALDSFGRQGVESIVDNIRSLPVTQYGPVNASGQLAASVRYELVGRQDGAQLTFWAASYALTAVFGRKPGKRPPLAQLLRWIDAKGILPRPDAKGRVPSKQSLAFLIGRAIAEKGTILHQAGSPSKLLDPITSPAAIDGLTKSILPGAVQHVLNSVREAVK